MLPARSSYRKYGVISFARSEDIKKSDRKEHVSKKGKVRHTSAVRKIVSSNMLHFRMNSATKPPALSGAPNPITVPVAAELSRNRNFFGAGTVVSSHIQVGYRSVVQYISTY